jgi:hypothetical protein
MSSSDARRARRLASKGSTASGYILEPETPDEWRAEIADYFASTRMRAKPICPSCVR